MKLPTNLDQWIAYIENELSEEETAKLDLAIQNDPDLALQIEGLRQLRSECGDEISLYDFINQKKNELKNKWFGQ
jgi:hypothetical protein